MTLPKKFKFTHRTTKDKFKAKLAGDQYVVSWKTADDRKESVTYPADSVASIVKCGDWVISPESFKALAPTAGRLQLLISEKDDASELAYHELVALRLTRSLINRLLDDRS